MVRYWRKRYSTYTKKTKYSKENTSFITSGNGPNYSIQVVPPTDVFEMRKVKHLTISMSTKSAEITAPWSYAIVYVPEGTTVNQLTIDASAATSLYEPNQFVMSCGIIDADAKPIRIHTPLARNLNAGDAIYLVINTGSGGAANIQGIVSYAITLN